jgi:FdrA protein
MSAFALHHDGVSIQGRSRPVPLGFTVRRSAYFDSVALMRVAEQARGLSGVVEVALVMGTPANRAMLTDAGLLPPDAPPTDAADLVIAVSAGTDEAVHAALERVHAWLAARPASAPGGAMAAAGEQAVAPARDRIAPRTLVSAARAGGAPNVAVIAVPGPYAALEAHQALSAGLHVFLFSDGVSLDDEVALKHRARARGLFVMGPECGTAIINGAGFGFANRVRRGAIGVVGASGTGIQEVTTLIHRLGAGVSHAIGTGGRDLHAAVGGITTRQALERLGADGETRVVVLVSKPSSREVADRVLAAAAAIGKPVVACLLGYEGAVPAGVRAATTLEEAATVAVALAGGTRADAGREDAASAAVPRASGASAVGEHAAARQVNPVKGTIRGLYSGGTLCDEARRVVGGTAHRFVDFGTEEYTRGRPHPIIDPSRRHAAILEAADEPGVGVLLLDLVLGDCAHPDPAGALDPVLIEAHERARGRARELMVVAHVVGTDDDTQNRTRQEDALRQRGVIVCPSNRAAALTARGLIEGSENAVAPERRGATPEGGKATPEGGKATPEGRETTPGDRDAG